MDINKTKTKKKQKRKRTEFEVQKIKEENYRKILKHIIRNISIA